tara:strand:+ start:667 stop:936 length:270 start_codon:yes stop_codon:yes gene_type:complete
MANMNVKIKIMPSSVETNLEEIKEKAEKSITNKEGKVLKFEEEPIAFGLKAIITFFLWPEEKGLDEIEEELGKIENVNSIQVIDMRRSI